MQVGRLALGLGIIALSCGGKTSGVEPPTPIADNGGGASSGAGGVHTGPKPRPDPFPPDSCFARGTLIATPTGNIPIQELRVGDLVQGFDLRRRAIVTQPVTEVLVHERQRIGLLRTAHGELKVTANHPVYDAARLDFVPAGSLRGPFRALELASNWSTAPATIGAFTPLDDVETVYNLTVANVHTYFAGGVLVHNKSRCGYPGDPPDCPCLADECTPPFVSGGASGTSGSGGVGGAGGAGGASAGNAAGGDGAASGDSAGGVSADNTAGAGGESG
jgi:hypothetical protein